MMRLGKFFIVGALGTPIHLSILYGLTEAGLFYIVSAAIAVFCSITFNYFLNHYWTFRDRHIGSSLARGYTKYLLVGGLTDTTYLGGMALLVEICHLHYMLSAGCLIIGLGLIRYKIVGRWIWRTREKSLQSLQRQAQAEAGKTSSRPVLPAGS